MFTDISEHSKQIKVSSVGENKLPEMIAWKMLALKTVDYEKWFTNIREN